MTLEQILKHNNLELPTRTRPGGKYSAVNVRSKTAYVAIQFPIFNDQHLYKGILGKDLSAEEGNHAMQICALNVLAHVDHVVGINGILGVNHLDIYYRSVDTFEEVPFVADGASGLFLTVLGDRGIHTRSIVGVQTLVRNFSVALVSSFSIY